MTTGPERGQSRESHAHDEKGIVSLKRKIKNITTRGGPNNIKELTKRTAKGKGEVKREIKRILEAMKGGGRHELH